MRRHCTRCAVSQDALRSASVSMFASNKIRNLIAIHLRRAVWPACPRSQARIWETSAALSSLIVRVNIMPIAHIDWAPVLTQSTFIFAASAVVGWMSYIPSNCSSTSRVSMSLWTGSSSERLMQVQLRRPWWTWGIGVSHFRPQGLVSLSGACDDIFLELKLGGGMTVGLLLD